MYICLKLKAVISGCKWIQPLLRGVTDFFIYTSLLFPTTASDTLVRTENIQVLGMVLGIDLRKVYWCRAVLLLTIITVLGVSDTFGRLTDAGRADKYLERTEFLLIWSLG